MICKQCSTEYKGKKSSKFCSRGCFGLSNRSKKDLVGKTFGKWLVLCYNDYVYYEDSKTGYHLWECECECGEIHNVREQLLVRGSSTQCKTCANKKLSETRTKYLIPSHLYLAIINNNRNKEVDIDDSYLFSIIEAQDYKCALSGVSICFSINSKENTASPDRKDSSIGYIKGNIQWVHKEVNRMKGSLSDSDFIRWCKLIGDNNDE